jgi:predicted nucleic acid-binding protein
MLERFADTSGWAAWTDGHQQFHLLAVTGFEEMWNQGGQVVTTNWVMAELTALLTSPLRFPKPQQIQLLQDIRSDPGVTIVAIDPILETSAWSLWQTRPDKEWTMVDCASFVVMLQRGIAEALTSDHHFEQAGFIRMLK